MNDQEKLWRAIGQVDEDLLDMPQKKRAPWVRYCALAACLCLLLAGGYAITRPAAPSEPAAPAVPEPQAELAAPERSPDTAEPPAAVERPRPGVGIPKLTLPTETETGVEMDMIGSIVYQGTVYTQTQGFYDPDAIAGVLPLLGEHIGHAKGTIDEWSTQDDYATELASTYEGEVYAVNGYDTDFRLCVVMAQEGETTCIQFLERLNDITLDYGEALFEDRLHIAQKLSSAAYLTHADWDAGSNELRHEATYSQSAWDAFYSAVCDGTFEDLYEETAKIYTDGRKQAHLYLSMSDGSEVELRLLEGGYVGYQPLGWYFVRIPEEVFEPIFLACQN